MIADSANSPISLYSLGWDENDVFRVVMVISYHHGDLVYTLELLSIWQDSCYFSGWLVVVCSRKQLTSKICVCSVEVFLVCWYELFLLYECFRTCSLYNIALQQFQVYDGDFGSLLMLYLRNIISCV